MENTGEDTLRPEQLQLPSIKPLEAIEGYLKTLAEQQGRDERQWTTFKTCLRTKVEVLEQQFEDFYRHQFGNLEVRRQRFELDTERIRRSFAAVHALLKPESLIALRHDVIENLWNELAAYTEYTQMALQQSERLPESDAEIKRLLVNLTQHLMQLQDLQG